jgi:hypothetical protein
MEVEWRIIPRFDGLYSVSNDGRVRTESRTVPWAGTTKGHHLPGRELNLYTNVAGYHVVNLKRPDGKRTVERVHRLVLETFVGPAPTGFDCRHLNGVPDDNRLENLQWGSRKENVQDMLAHGTAQVGSECSWAVLTEARVVEIRRLRKAGLSWKALSLHFGLSQSTVRGAVNSKSWKHVGEDLAKCPTCDGEASLWIRPTLETGRPREIVCPTCDGEALVDIATANRLTRRMARLRAQQQREAR